MFSTVSSKAKYSHGIRNISMDTNSASERVLNDYMLVYFISGSEARRKRSRNSTGMLLP